MQDHKQYPRAIVGALIFDKEGRFFLMRSSGKYQSQWIVPGGKVDWGESLLAALKREIQEETNLSVTKIQFFGVRELIEPDRHFVFLEHICQIDSEPNVILNDEATEFGWFSMDDVRAIDVARPTLDLINEYFSRSK